jgi:hypothetical protein
MKGWAGRGWVCGIPCDGLEEEVAEAGGRVRRFINVFISGWMAAGAEGREEVGGKVRGRFSALTLPTHPLLTSQLCVVGAISWEKIEG